MYRTIRDLHLYAGLFVSPFVLVYAISAIVLNHGYLPWGGDEPTARRTVALRAAEDTNALEVAKRVRAQLDVPGEIGFVNRNRRTQRISFPIETPGAVTNVRYDPASRVLSCGPDADRATHRQKGPLMDRSRRSTDCNPQGKRRGRRRR